MTDIDISKLVQVPELKWIGDASYARSEDTSIGRYEVERLASDSKWFLRRGLWIGGVQWIGGVHTSLDAAKAAAQADYERRILSSLEPSTAFEAMVEALEGLVKCCEEHDAAIASVMGKPPGWKDAYLDTARAALALARGERS